jgi:hypothetical protein
LGRSGFLSLNDDRLGRRRCGDNARFSLNGLGGGGGRELGSAFDRDVFDIGAAW